MDSQETRFDIEANAKHKQCKTFLFNKD